MSTLKPSFMSYEEWIKAHPEEELKETDCSFCDGSGTETCHCCGSEKNCEKCDGTGSTMSARDAYNEQKKKDKELFEKYVNSISSLQGGE